VKTNLAFFTISAAILCFSCSGTSRTERIAGTNCVVKVVTDANGKITDVDTDPPCFKGRLKPGDVMFVVVPPQNAREPLKENAGGITFGTATTKCYGPPNPDPPMCVCTREPCP
jgi:hypothetical protein